VKNNCLAIASTFAAVALFSSLSFAKMLAWQPQYETFNQLGCEGRLKFNMVSGAPIKINITGDSAIDRYILPANQFLVLSNISKNQEYSWDVEPHEHGANALNTDLYFTTNGY